MLELPQQRKHTNPSPKIHIHLVHLVGHSGAKWLAKSQCITCRGRNFIWQKIMFFKMIFHHLLQEKMTVWKQVRFKNLLFSHGSQALFSTVFQENQQRFLFVTVFRWCDDSRNPPWLEWQHFFYIKLQKYNNKIGWQAGGYPISLVTSVFKNTSTSLWTNEQKCGLLSFHFAEYFLNRTWYLIVRLGIFNCIIGWKWCARKDVWKNRFQMLTKFWQKPMLMSQKSAPKRFWQKPILMYTKKAQDQ